MQPLIKVSAERLNFSARLKESLKLSHGLPPSPTVLAREFNFRFAGKPITVHAARKWLVGDSIPTQDKLRALASWLAVPVEWLRFGGTRTETPVLTGNPVMAVSSPHDELVRMFLALPHKERVLAQDFIGMLRKKSLVPGTLDAAEKETQDHS